MRPRSRTRASKTVEFAVTLTVAASTEVRHRPVLSGFGEVDEMAALRLGVISYGRRVHSLIRGPFREVEPDLRIVGVVDPGQSGPPAGG